MSNTLYLIIGLIIGAVSILAIDSIIFINYKDRLKAPKDKTVGVIIINQSDPDKEYFECQLYSQAFFKDVHQKPTVTFDVEID